jgi:hypothetical protein
MHVVIMACRGTTILVELNSEQPFGKNKTKVLLRIFTYLPLENIHETKGPSASEPGLHIIVVSPPRKMSQL